MNELILQIEALEGGRHLVYTRERMTTNAVVVVSRPRRSTHRYDLSIFNTLGHNREEGLTSIQVAIRIEGLVYAENLIDG